MRAPSCVATIPVTVISLVISPCYQLHLSLHQRHELSTLQVSSFIGSRKYHDVSAVQILKLGSKMYTYVQPCPGTSNGYVRIS